MESETEPSVQGERESEVPNRPLSLLVLLPLKWPSQPLRIFIYVEFSQMVIKRI